MDIEDSKGALVYKTVQLEYEWGENPVVDEYAHQYGYSLREPIIFVGVVNALSKVVSFIAAMPNGSIELFRDSENPTDELERVLETDYLMVSGMDGEWSISSAKPIPDMEELAEVALMEEGSYSLE